jgi:hypothetical protein
MTENPRPICCERALCFGDQIVKVTIYNPYLHEDYDEEYWCEYEISQPISRSSYTIGGDATQALILALQKAGVDLYASEYYKNGLLTWSGGMVPGDLGFPVPSGLQDLLPVEMR